MVLTIDAISVFFNAKKGGIYIKIFIDAGHNYSGWNTGAVGNGLREQDITYSVSRLLAEKLNRQDFEIKLSRATLETNLGTDNGSSINARYKMANEYGADLFISIHCNAGGGTGVETLYYKDDSKQFAQVVNDTYAEITGLRNRGIKYRDNLGVIMYTKMPAILIELAFIDTVADAEVLKNKQEELAEAIAIGVCKYLKREYITPEEENKEVVTQTEIVIDGEQYVIDRILKDGTNFIALRGLEQAGFIIGYDPSKNLPMVTTPKK